jgi:hypothetical protein
MMEFSLLSTNALCSVKCIFHCHGLSLVLGSNRLNQMLACICEAFACLVSQTLSKLSYFVLERILASNFY